LNTITNREKKSILIGTLLGDSCLWRHPKSKNFNLQCTHSEVQYDYIVHKANLINTILFGNTNFSLWKSINNGYSKITAYTYRTRVHPLIESVRKLMYQERKKIITRQLLDRLTPQGLALWYMDDGFKVVNRYPSGTIRQRTLGLSTCSFTEDEHNIMQQYFKEVWGINFSKFYRKRFNNWILRCGVQEGLKFQSIIEPHVPSCMKYKLFYEKIIGNNNILKRRAPDILGEDIVHTNRNIRECDN
jgi:hypothetical protein